MEADILGISPAAVWRHASTTASASGGQNNINSAYGSAKYAQAETGGDILLSDNNQQNDHSRQTSHHISHVHIYTSGHKVKPPTLLKRIQFTQTSTTARHQASVAVCVALWLL